LSEGFACSGAWKRNARGLGRRNYLIEGVAPVELPGQRVNQDACERAQTSGLAG
jgi:hypothetical protein